MGSNPTPSALAGARLVAAALVVGALASGCSGSGEPDASNPLLGTTGSRASVDVRPVQPTITTTTLVAAVFPFVTYRVEGEGIVSELEVYPDGRVTYEGQGGLVEYTVPGGSAVRELRAALEAADVGSLEPSYGPAGVPLRFNLLFGGRSVRFAPGAEPPALRDAVDMLDAELERGREQSG